MHSPEISAFLLRSASDNSVGQERQVVPTAVSIHPDVLAFLAAPWTLWYKQIADPMDRIDCVYKQTDKDTNHDRSKGELPQTTVSVWERICNRRGEGRKRKAIEPKSHGGYTKSNMEGGGVVMNTSVARRLLESTGHKSQETENENHTEIMQ
jgi:hypothetical protein